MTTMHTHTRIPRGTMTTKANIGEKKGTTHHDVSEVRTLQVEPDIGEILQDVLSRQMSSG